MVKIDHPMLLRTILNSHKSLRKHSIVSHFKSISPTSIPKIFPLSLPNTMNLILFWKHKDGQVGHHFLSDLRFGSLVMRNDVEEVLSGFESSAGGMYAEAQALQRNLIDEWRRSEFGSGSGGGHGIGRRDEECLSIVCRVDGDKGDYFDWDFQKLGPARIKVIFELKNLGITKQEIEYKLKLNRNSEEVEKGVQTAWIGSLIYNGKIASLEYRLIETECWMVYEGILGFRSMGM
ncbi:hypothetical protein DFH28DRAFT_10637 [Melampsora americana]|nr:hypothetical protein DFH28DRAFT_10637 [Melampsora americana]